MLVNESIYKFYQQQHLVIARSYEGFVTNPDPELLHQLRLGIKKLRSLDVLAGYFPSNTIDITKSYVPELKSLFKAAGQLRDLQVQIQMLTDFENKQNLRFPEFKEWLIYREKELIKRLGETGRQKVKHTENNNNTLETGELFKQASTEVVLKSARRALRVLYGKAKKLSAGEIYDHDLHKIRIITKRMRYIYSVVLYGFPGFRFKKISITFLREIEVAAGYWHDCLMRVELFSKFFHQIDETDREITDKYKKLQKNFNAEMEETYIKACNISAIGYVR